MIRIRKSHERGHFDHGWLDTFHSFSFSDYHDPKFMGFRSLRVINEDRVAPGKGFGTHPHRDMEIITYVIEGALEHRDSLGTQGVIRAGELQRITAGTGITHSEFNSSQSEPVHLYQIWIVPDRRGHLPSYEQRPIAGNGTGVGGGLRLIATNNGRDGSLTIHQDASILLASLGAGDRIEHPIEPGRHLWLQVTRGSVMIDANPLEAGDGAAISEQKRSVLTSGVGAEVLMFDLA